MPKMNITVTYTHLDGDVEDITEDFLAQLYTRDVFGSHHFVPGADIVESMKNAFCLEEGLDENTELEF